MNGTESTASGARRLRLLLALVVAAMLGLAVALPVFAVEEPVAENTAPEEPASGDGGTAEDGFVQPQVVGGEPVPNSRYPFMVSIQADRSNAPPYQEHFCGGSLIDRDSVLTAAHCADVIGRLETPTTVAFRDVRIVVGLTELNSDQGQARRIASFSDVQIHPRFNRRTFEYDAAVIELDRPVSGIPPIKLARAGVERFERPGRLLKVAGWGNTIKQGPNFGQPDSFPNRMREAQVPVVSDTRAERVYQQGYFPPIMVAAGREGKDTCQGDSGGPMWSPTTDGPRQVGITSFGVGCGTRDYPGVYAEVNATSIRSFATQAAVR